MKILSLNLHAWGPFTNRSIDLSKGAEGLHLIYGPNETGKSAALRGLKAMLFGIEERAPDNFIHEYKNLRIGATLRGPNGEIVEIIRKKGRAKSLRSPEGDVLDESILQEFLGGVNLETFSRMFGLNHEELTVGGKEIATGKGDLGQSLFAAAFGGHSIHQVLDPLEEEAGKLFAPKAAKRSVNLWLDQFQQAMKQVKEASLPGREWEEHSQAFREAESKRSELQDEIRSIKANLIRLERIRSALPLIAQRAELQARRTEMGDVLLLPEGFGKRRQATTKALSEAHVKQRKVSRKLQELHAQIDGLIVPAVLLREADAINDLHKSLGSHVSAMRDLPKRIGEAAQLEVEAASILQDIHPGATAEEADSFRIGLVQRNRVRELGSRYGRLQLALQSETATVERLKAKIEKARESLAGIPSLKDPGNLKKLLNRMRKAGDLEAEVEKARRKLETEVTDAGIELKRLSLWSGTLEQLETLSVPEDPTITRYEKGYTEARAEI